MMGGGNHGRDGGMALFGLIGLVFLLLAIAAWAK